MLIINEIYIEGFGSIVKPLTYQFNHQGLNIIQGPVGSGKTTIIEALYWVLYGVKTKKKSTIEPWPNVITKAYQGTLVRLHFTKDNIPYTITACSEYNGKVLGKVGKSRIILERDGKEDETFKKHDIKKEIVKLLGYSLDLFKSTIFFGQRVNKFMDEDGPSKKKIMEEAFSIGYIAYAQDLVKQTLKLEMAEQYKIKPQVLTLNLTKSGLKDKIKSLKKTEEDYESQKQSRIETLVKTISNLKTKTQNLTQYQTTLDELKANMVIAKEELNIAYEYSQSLVHNPDPKISELNAKIRSLKKDLASFGDIPLVCHACNRPMDAGVIKEYKINKANQIAIINSSIESTTHKRDKRLEKESEAIKIHSASKLQATSNIDLCKARINLLEKDLGNASDAFAQCKQHKRIWELTEQQLKELEVEKLEIDFDTPLAQLQSTKKDLRILKPQLKALNKTIADIEWLIKDPLSNNGLKSYIFDTMIGKINQELLKYQNTLGFKLEMGINMESSNKDFIVRIIKDGIEIPYQDLSGGQNQLCNLAIALATHDTVTLDKPINILILDECFEGLDSASIEKVGELLNGRVNNKSIHLITHREFTPTNSHITWVTLEKPGITTISYN